MKKLVLLALLLLPSLARAQDLKDRFNIRLTLTGMFLTEQQSGLVMPNKQEIDGYSLAYADLRLQLDGRRLPGNFELHIDGRVRITGELGINEYDVANAAGYTSRGYLGGREYELRQMYVMRRGESTDFALGRFFVPEADLMKLDGVRVWYRFKKPHWDFSAFAGGYPNPYSRSLTTDYQGANGYYGAPLGGGADVSYVYDKYWGSLAAAVIYLGGNNDGGPINIMDVTPVYTTETPRSFLNWVGYERFTSWLDIYHNLVLDLSGSAGVQLTRLDAFATVRAGKHLTFRLGYDHLSSLGIEIFLTPILQSRTYLAQNGVTMLPSITNNLVVERTAHDQAYLNVDAHWGLFNVWAEGRVRIRSLINETYDPQFAGQPTASIAPLAGDATFGLRDLGTLKKLRLGLWYTFLDDYRSLSYILGFSMGRNFLEERLGFDFEFLYAKTTDFGANGTFAAIPTSCASPNTGLPTSSANIPIMMMGMTTSYVAAALDQTCHGTRDGGSYEAGLTITGNPWKHWFGMIDYRVVAIDGKDANNPGGAPVIFTHQLLLRIEARY
jgi:hypothetical protein